MDSARPRAPVGSGRVSYQTIDAQLRGAEWRITLARPDSMNAWNRELGEELLDALERAAGDDAIRAVTITGAGRAFSSGADLKAGFELTAEGRPDLQRRLEELY